MSRPPHRGHHLTRSKLDVECPRPGPSCSSTRLRKVAWPCVTDPHRNQRRARPSRTRTPTYRLRTLHTREFEMPQRTRRWLRLLNPEANMSRASERHRATKSGRCRRPPRRCSCRNRPAGWFREHSPEAAETRAECHRLPKQTHLARPGGRVGSLRRRETPADRTIAAQTPRRYRFAGPT